MKFFKNVLVMCSSAQWLVPFTTGYIYLHITYWAYNM